MVLKTRRVGLAFLVALSMFLPPAAALIYIHSEGPDPSFGPAGWVITALVGLVPLMLAAAVQPWLWPDWSRERAAITTLSGQVGCWVIGLPAVLIVGFAACAHTHRNISWFVFLGTTVAVATYVLASPRRAWLCPLAVIAGAVVALLVLTLLPSAFCET